MPRDQPTERLIRTFCDRFEVIQLVTWAGNFRAARGCEPLTLWASVIEEICSPFVAQKISTLTDLTTAAVGYGLKRIADDRAAFGDRILTAEDRQLAAERRDAAARQQEQLDAIAAFGAAELGQKLVLARKAKRNDDNDGLFADVA